MKLIVGLGNPGEKYINTRHNVGFELLDAFLKRTNEELPNEISWSREKKLKAKIAKTSFKGEEIILAKPLTFMNLSGHSVAKILNFYSIETKDLLVIFDDIDLPLGKIRLRPKGSAGTHNGMKSIINEISSTEFHRLKIGIESRGVHAPEQQDLSSFVLSRFLPEEIEEIKKLVPEIFSEIEKFILT